MKAKFRLYLDFDGIVNAKCPPYPSVMRIRAPKNDNKFLARLTFVTFAPAVVERLDYILKTYDVELVWVTTWNESEAILKMPHLLKGLHGGRVLTPSLNERARNKKEWTQWKADGIIADQHSNPLPFIWVDDNAHQHHGEVVSSTVKTQHLFVTPKSSLGLTMNNLAIIEQFVENMV